MKQNNLDQIQSDLVSNFASSISDNHSVHLSPEVPTQLLTLDALNKHALFTLNFGDEWGEDEDYF